MRFINLDWSYNKEEGVVKYTEAFDEAEWITKLDMLKDCMYDLNNKYSSVLKEEKKCHQQS